MGPPWCNLKDNDAAVAWSGRAVEIYRRLVNGEGRGELAEELAEALLNQAAALRDLGDITAAVVLYDRAIEIYRRLVEQEGRRRSPR